MRRTRERGGAGRTGYKSEEKLGAGGVSQLRKNVLRRRKEPQEESVLVGLEGKRGERKGLLFLNPVAGEKKRRESRKRWNATGNDPIMPVIIGELQ